MKDKILSLITDLRTDRRITRFDEATTKQVVVLRLLSILGWDPFNADEVRPEYTLGGMRVDYALRLSNTSKVFIEVKRIGENLEIHQEQLLNYSFQEGVKLAILTDGATWWFYLSLNEGSWEQRRFYTVDLLQQEPEDVSNRLVDFLSRDNIASGKAIEHAEGVYKSQQKKNILEGTLPKAWNKIIYDADEILVDLIGETTEKICGFRPDADAVTYFLKKHANTFLIPEAAYTARSSKPSSPPTQPIVVTSENYLGKSISGFTFRGKYYNARTWKELLVNFAEVLYRMHGAEFPKVLEMRGRTRVYFSNNSNQMREPKQIGNSKYYVETNWNANKMVSICLELLPVFGYAEKDLQIDAQ